MELILARSPQAKGRVERFFETAQDRWVKERRLAEVTTRAQANALAHRLLIPHFNRRFTVSPASANDAHRPLGPEHPLAALLSLQHERVVTNDYTVRFENRIYQIDKPLYPGLRRGRVRLELRLDGTMAIRLGDKYLKYHEVATRGAALGGGAPPAPPEFNAFAADARGGRAGPALGGGGPALWRTADRRALGLHSCRALSSRRRCDQYPKEPLPSSRKSPLAEGLQGAVTASGHRTFLSGREEDISIVL